MSNGLVKVIDYIVNRFISAICDGNSKTYVNPKSKVTEITIANQKDGWRHKEPMVTQFNLSFIINH